MIDSVRWICRLCSWTVGLGGWSIPVLVQIPDGRSSSLNSRQHLVVLLDRVGWCLYDVLRLKFAGSWSNPSFASVRYHTYHRGVGICLNRTFHVASDHRSRILSQIVPPRGVESWLVVFVASHRTIPTHNPSDLSHKVTAWEGFWFLKGEIQAHSLAFQLSWCEPAWHPHFGERYA